MHSSSERKMGKYELSYVPTIPVMTYIKVSLSWSQTCSSIALTLWNGCLEEARRVLSSMAFRNRRYCKASLPRVFSFGVNQELSWNNLSPDQRYQPPSRKRLLLRVDFMELYLIEVPILSCPNHTISWLYPQLFRTFPTEIWQPYLSGLLLEDMQR